MTKFNPPGNPMSTIHTMKDKNVLVAYNTEHYVSGPYTPIHIGYVRVYNGDVFIKTPINSSNEPASRFQRWWELPDVFE